MKSNTAGEQAIPEHSILPKNVYQISCGMKYRPLRASEHEPEREIRDTTSCAIGRSSEQGAEQDSEEDYEYELCTDAWRQFANRPYYKRVKRKCVESPQGDASSQWRPEDRAEAETSGQSGSMRINMHSMGSAPPTDSQIVPSLEGRESVGISPNQSESVETSLNPSSSMAEIKLLLRSHGYRTSGVDHDIFIKSDGAGTIRFKLHVDDGAGWSNSRTLHYELCGVMQEAWPYSKWEGDMDDPMAFSISRVRKSTQPADWGHSSSSLVAFLGCFRDAGRINVHSMESTHEESTWYTGWYPGQELPTIPTLVVLCGGKERKGDIKSYVEKLKNPTMHCVVIDPQEGGYAQDLRQPTVRKALAVWLQSDFIHTTYWPARTAAGGALCEARIQSRAEE